MTKQVLINKLQEIIYQLHMLVPEEIKAKVGDLWFVFDENTIMQHGKLLVFASHEPGTRTITFYLDFIKREKFNDKRLRELVYHEYAHACGMTEEQAVVAMEKYIKKNEIKEK